MNPPSFTVSSVNEDPKNFVEELQKVFEIMHVVDVERVDLDAYQLKSVARIWFDQWKKGRVEDASIKELNLKQRMWLELLKDYDMSILYHPGKANVIADSLSIFFMGSTAHFEEDK
ncbi:hypothetical protein MTR67_026796 [Solanum verrucosum]|uniref:Gag-pol polyprotein n=1 Tax=Solanum verrucosum TaxID=315347 RepID=A0AAF0TUU0_SOLVR|nr:hypothetical protein MTR67_026796 [Solanum verrucosum]